MRVVEQAADVYYFALSPEPLAPLSDEVLQQAVGGTGAPYMGGDLHNSPCHATGHSNVLSDLLPGGGS